MKNIPSPSLFIWIPKTAGTSIVNSIQGMRIYLNNFAEFNDYGSVTFGHYHVKELLKLNVISKKFWQYAYKFTVVRNPYDRFISLFQDFKRTNRIDPKMNETGFAYMLLKADRKPGLYNDNGFSQCASQVDWLLPGIEIKRFEELKLDYHLNKSDRSGWENYYNSQLAKIVTELYFDDLILLNYEII